MATEVFYVANGNGEFAGDRVFLSEITAIFWADDMGDRDGVDYYIDSVVLPFAGKYISRVRAYYGFDYNFGSDTNSIYDSIDISPFYASVELAKLSSLWKDVETRANLDKDNFNFYPLKICSKDDFGNDFYFGDVFERKVNVEIKRFKVVRR